MKGSAVRVGCGTVVLVLLVLGGACGAPEAPSSSLEDRAVLAESVIDTAAIMGPVRFLSDDLLGGRGPATEGDALTQLYLRTQFEQLGLSPGAGDGAWEQPFDVVGVTSTLPAAWTFRAENASPRLKWSADYIAWCEQQQPKTQLTDADLVFVGYGITAPEFDWDDYKGVDLAGKVLVILNNDPDWSDDLFAGSRRLYYGRWDYKYESAARQGAAGAIIIHTTPSAGYPWQVIQSSWTGMLFGLPAGDEARLQIGAWITDAAARDLMSAAGHELDDLVAAAKSKDFTPVPLGIRTSLKADCDVQRKRTANVAGLLPGSDPSLSKEVVIYTAHHDHIGTGDADDSGDAIYNGALDNAAGIAQMLAIARAYTELPEPPKRSILFLAVAAEEQGLLGSGYYAQNPTFHPGRIAANVNIDGGNIWGRALDVPLIGKGKSNLDQVAERAAARQGRTLVDEAFPDRGFFYRSDQFNFAKIGVPALYFDTGTQFAGQPEGWGAEQIEAWERDSYHQPSDEWNASWDLSGMIEDAKLAFFAGLSIAEAPELPAWNPGDEFEAERKRAIEAAQAGGP